MEKNYNELKEILQETVNGKENSAHIQYAIGLLRMFLIKDEKKGELDTDAVSELKKEIPGTSIIYRDNGIKEMSIGLQYNDKLAIEFMAINKECIKDDLAGSIIETFKNVGDNIESDKPHKFDNNIKFIQKCIEDYYDAGYIYKLELGGIIKIYEDETISKSGKRLKLLHAKYKNLDIVFKVIEM